MKTNKKIPISAIIGILLVLGVVISIIFVAVEQSAKASPMQQLDDKTLEEKAIAAAQMAGLQGAPTATRHVRITLAEWLTLNDAELGKDAAKFGLTPDTPVFVLAMRGNVKSLLVGESPPQNKGMQEQYNNITIVLNAITGDVMWTVTTRDGFSMPVPVP
ncbi:MAG: hypothetical protein AUJ21_00275 [Anaerolineae bacterium CG1_02_58_13]|nr:MAG: hypothetical protein AUJ21_00275 [Anaerolineae bacterium CG1_02_58_13]